MKKTLLLGAAVAIGLSSFAQSNRQAAKLNSKTINKAKYAVDADAFPQMTSPKTTGPVAPNAVCNPAAFTSGPNAFGVGGGVTTFQQNCLAYNQDLNTYAWTHRRSQEWAATQTMGSGSMQQTYIKIGTGTKDSTIMYLDNGANPGRYPGGVLYSPPGNSNWTSAWALGTGPVLDASGAAWVGSWYSHRQLTGTSSDQTLPAANMNVHLSPAAPFGSTLFMNVDMQQVGTKVLVAGELNRDTTSSNPNFNKAWGTVIGKCDFATGSPVWSYDSLMPPFLYNPAGHGYIAEWGSGARMAFSPDGEVGYLVFMGRLATNYMTSADSTMSPIVYKSTDSGATWMPVLQGYDWNTKHPELMKNVGGLLGGVTNFQPYLNHGIDVTVDANDVLHLVCTMVAPYADGQSADSLIYTYTYNWDYQNWRPVIWDLMTEGTCWKTLMVDSLLTAYVGSDAGSDTTAAFNPIGNGAGGGLPYGGRVQVSRASDGSRIFYSWADSDSSVTGNLFNTQPDLFMKSLDVTNNMMTTMMPVTNGVQTCFFHMMADEAYFDAGTSKWVCPMVYSLPRNGSGGVYDGVQPTDHFWVDCGAFGSADYTMAAAINNEVGGSACAIGVAQYNSNVASVANFPNPFNHSTNIVVSLTDAQPVSVHVYNALGSLVFTKKMNGHAGENTIVFDGSSYNAGVYYYTVTAGYEKITKKMIIQK